MNHTDTHPDKFKRLKRGSSKPNLDKGKPEDVPNVLKTLAQPPKEIAFTPAEIIANTELEDEVKRDMLIQRQTTAGTKTKTLWKPEFVQIARKLATIGVPERDIASLFAVDFRTFSGWKRANRTLREALKEGDSQKRTNLIMQMQMSAGAGIFQMQMFLAKNWLGMSDRIDQRLTGGVDITYKSYIPQEKGKPGPDPESRKGKTKKLQDRNDK